MRNKWEGETGDLMSVRKLFTLVEMLVVIAIIAILASLLMPALQSALESSKRTQCVNKLRNMYVLSIQYLENNNYYLPHPNWTWRGKIAQYMDKPSTSGNANVNLFYCPGAPVIPADKINGKNGSYCPSYPNANPVTIFRRKYTSIWLYDSTNNPNDYYRAPDYNAGKTGNNHGGLCNELYWDGRVEAIVMY